MMDIEGLHRIRGSRPTRDDLLHILDTMIMELGSKGTAVFIILDAIDEVPRDAAQCYANQTSSTREYSLKILEHIQSRHSNCHMLAISRDEVDIRRSMSDMGALPLSITALIEGDVDSYVKDAVEGDIAQNGWKEPYREKILSRIFKFQDR